MLKSCVLQGHSMIDQSDYLELPEDPELAFLKLEKSFRGQLQARLDDADNDSPYNQWYIDYVNSTLGAAIGLGINYFNDTVIPSSLERNFDYHGYISDFRTKVDLYVIQIRIKHSRRAKHYSVPLDSATREKIRHHLNQLKDITRQLEISDLKRDAILKKIIGLEAEIERDRTRFELAMALIIEGSNAVGVAGEKTTKWRELIDSITRLLGKAKEKDVQGLPPPDDHKQIEPPKKQLPPPSGKPREIDDDIPF
jgi:hypothetical protein